MFVILIFPILKKYRRNVMYNFTNLRLFRLIIVVGLLFCTDFGIRKVQLAYSAHTYSTVYNKFLLSSMVIRCYQGFSSVKMATQLYNLASDISKHYSGLFLSFWYIELTSFLLLTYLCLYYK